MTSLAVFILLAFFFGGLLYAYSLRTQPKACRRDRWRKYWTFLVIVLSVTALIRLGPVSTVLLVSAICARGAYELFDAGNRARSAGGAFYKRTWAAYVPLAILSVVGACLAPTDLVLFVFAVIATFDGASQISGQLFGRRKLAPWLSPNKTIEGLVGGILTATLAATLMYDLTELSLIQAMGCGIGLSLIGLIGDLSASWVKRNAGIKDFRQAFPSHGGVLDRFDSFLPNCAVLGVLGIHYGFPG